LVREDLRNIAIIAHVDHGKTTLTDGLLKQGQVFRDNQDVATCVMDSGDIERQRGITITAKNTAVHYKNVKINIVDTPGHADFGGEVERIMKMVNGVILLVDGSEGPMPQTRQVLKEAIACGHKIIICINKIDKPDTRIGGEVEEEILDLLCDLDATDEQLDSPILYCCGRQGTASLSPDVPGVDLVPLFETILSHIPAPEGNPDDGVQMLISNIDYNDFLGRIGVGRIDRGTLCAGQEYAVCNFHDTAKKGRVKIVSLEQFDGLGRVKVDSATVGDIVCFSSATGSADISIGDTVCSTNNVTPLEFVKVSEPTMEITIGVNDSPFAGKEGKFVTSRQLRARLYKELLKDVSLRITDGDTTDCWYVAGRGEMHLSILIETMRREGYELACSNPRVLYKEIDGEKQEPMERALFDVPSEYVGAVIEKLGQRKGELVTMNPIGNGARTRIEYVIPTRCLIGYRSEFLTATHGEGIMSTLFEGYAPFLGDIPMRFTGTLIASEAGQTTRYGLYNTQDRGTMFIGPQVDVYEGMIVGETNTDDQVSINVCKEKHLTAVRSTGADEKLILTPPKIFSLEEALDFVQDDELVEVTPKNIRLRKKILNTELRMKELMRIRRENAK